MIFSESVTVASSIIIICHFSPSITDNITEMARITKFLATKAHQLEKGLNRDSWDVSIPSMIKREIALTAEQINSFQKLHKDQMSKLFQAKCDTNTELIQMEQRTPKYSPYRFPERDKLQQRLFNIEKERRNLTLRLHDKKQSLEDRLLSHINKHEQLDI